MTTTADDTAREPAEEWCVCGAPDSGPCAKCLPAALVARQLDRPRLPIHGVCPYGHTADDHRHLAVMEGELRDARRAVAALEEELVHARQNADHLRAERDAAGRAIIAVSLAAEQLDKALAGRLPSLPDIRAAVEHIDRALAAYDAPPSPGSPAGRAQEPRPAHNHTTGYPTFAPDADLVVNTSDGPQQWTGARWNEHVHAATKARNGVAERLIICPPSTCTTTCPANPDRAQDRAEQAED